MALENKLKITDLAELARKEERIGKTYAVKMFDIDFLSSLKCGTVDALSKIYTLFSFPIYTILRGRCAP